jgi:hypothetical protein
MKTPRSEPFPFEAARDLLGIVRAMYRAARSAEAGGARLEAIARVGAELRAAIDLALEHAPGTLGHAAAWQRAEQATRRLGDLVDVTTPLAPTLDAAAARMLAPRALRTAGGGEAREAARRGRRARG